LQGGEGFSTSCSAFVPGIHVFVEACENVDGRDKPGHDADSGRF
jgi:hypothetical protein